jgi:hypothetical protein
MSPTSQDYSAPHFRIARNKEQNRAIGVLAAGRLSGKSALSSEYHRRQATTLTQLAQTTRNQDTAKALLRMAAEHLVTVRITEPTDKPGVDRRRDPS